MLEVLSTTCKSFTNVSSLELFISSQISQATKTVKDWYKEMKGGGWDADQYSQFYTLSYLSLITHYR